MSEPMNLTIGGKTKRSTTGQHPVSVDWNGLPDASQAFIVAYGLRQYLADAMAGAESEADAKAKIDARLAKLVSGDLSRTRGDGDKPDTVDTRALKNAKAAIRNAAKKQGKTVTKEQVASGAATLVTSQPKWKAEAKKQLDAEAKVAESLMDEETSDLLADLLKGSEPEEDDEEEDESAAE